MEPQTVGNLPSDCLGKARKLYNADRTQYIKRRLVVNSEQGNLPYSGKFQAGGVQWKLHGESGLLTSTNRYVAQVSIDAPPDELDRATTFNCAKQIVQNGLKVVRVLLDEESLEVQNSRKKFDEYLESAFEDSIDDLQKAEDLYQLERILMTGDLDTMRLVETIEGNAFMSVLASQSICEYGELEAQKAARDAAFAQIQCDLGGTRNWVEALKKSVMQGIRNHKAKALGMSPGILKSNLQNLQDRCILFITKQDLKLFSNLQTMNETVMTAMLPNILNCYNSTIASLKPNALKTVLPITNLMFSYLCRSLSDISEEIASKALRKDFLQYTATGWIQIRPVQWTTPPSAMDRCLEKQLALMIKLVNHFEVGRSSAFQRFPYEFKLFVFIESNPQYQVVIEQANKTFDRNETAELYVWACLLDDTIAQVFRNDQHIVDLSEVLLILFMRYWWYGKMSLDSLESLRMITHNTIRFVAQAGTFVYQKNEQGSDILTKQIDYMYCAYHQGKMSFEDYRDMIEVFAQYWKLCSVAIDGIIAKLPGECFKRDVEEIQSLLFQCMSRALDKKVQLTEFINFCRAFEDLLIDLQNLSLEWIVRLPSDEYTDVFIKKGMIRINTTMDRNKRCYNVKDYEKFVKMYSMLFDNAELPRNFLVETIKTLLKCIANMEAKKCWSNNNALTEAEQLNAASLLITSVRSYLLNLNDQTDYISLNCSLEESTKPFVTASNESSSLEDFEKRVLLIKESLSHNQNPNAMDLGSALKLYRDNNKSSYMEENLGWCYRKYSKQFDQFMVINNKHSPSSRIQQIVQETLRVAGHSPFSEWLNEFKRNDLPTILAGLSAVWSLHVSKDQVGSGQCLKPHCIQILCVFRLLSAQREDQGVRNHLAQVSTGQGKSLILALVASVLALSGHFVKILCCSRYLATRDEKDFEKFYDFFGIRSKISYQTFEVAAREQNNLTTGNAHSPKPILLIDEVDVLLDDKLYCKTINSIKSYAGILEKFSLILGVSGTLTTLSNYERKVVKDHYNITELSVMPSFVGDSNLKFNHSKDFTWLNSVTSWMNAIFCRINVIINAKRSVLIFFDTDITIYAFKLQFSAQLNRLNVLTVDTSPADKERFINEAGVSRTVTLATREMGRGVDYKSSVAVEKNGGIHVIQSFFSEDVKEETQVKGRTARKGNRGSYELIICLEDLSDESCSTVSYSRLNESRLRKMTAKEVAREEMLN